MAEYIEREAVERMLRYDIPLLTWMHRSVNAAMKSMGATIERLDAIPAADVRPVVHGRWVETTNDVFHRIPTCLVCGTETLIKYNFCPNCGAQMDAPSRPEPSEEERAQTARRCGRESVD